MEAMNALQASRLRPRTGAWRAHIGMTVAAQGTCGAAFARDVRKCLQRCRHEVPVSFPVRVPQTIRDAGRFLEDDLRAVMEQLAQPDRWQGHHAPQLGAVVAALNTIDAEVFRLGETKDCASWRDMLRKGGMGSMTNMVSVRGQLDRTRHLTRTAKALFDELVCMQITTHGLRYALQCRGLDWRHAPNDYLTPARSTEWIAQHAATDGVNMARQALLIAFAAGQRDKRERMLASFSGIANVHMQLASLCEQSASAMDRIRDDARHNEWKSRECVDIAQGADLLIDRRQSEMTGNSAAALPRLPRRDAS
ncbi:hypothetical protein [Pandoraea sp. PE-S2R-1]|uniref:hypothetical protein n=1 Tax=Pandoraea sp. PE-S2R-1 TaxID=1986994 RepID=UPI0011315858|nr:hypothetical protein [Pandoraea sp. PE-S2R-1]